MNPYVGSREIAVEIRHLLDCPMDVQADEQWSYVGNKKNQRWLWYAIDTVTGCVLSFVFGRRKDDVCEQLISNLKAFNIRTYYTDDWGSYSALIPKDKHVIGKQYTQKIENKNLLFRTRIKRLARKTICFSKLEALHDTVRVVYKSILFSIFINQLNPPPKFDRNNVMVTQTLKQVIPSIPASDGAGVKLRRSLGQSQDARHDPFLMLDEFFSDNPDEYLQGFPSHPHRGFETVTYMLDGHMRHEDHLGHRGDLRPGDVQWMTAGRGIIHSEMPQQAEGRMRGFQLWINLPAKEKMKPAAYRDISSQEIPTVPLANGGEVRVIAGELVQAESRSLGPIQGLSTEPLYLDVHLPGGAVFQTTATAGHQGFLYVYEGEATVGDERQALPRRAAGLLSDGDQILVQAGPEGTRFLLIAGKPLNEPIVQYGPFVMNTREEIEQALADYRAGTLAMPKL